MASQKAGTYVPPHKRFQDNDVNEAPSSTNNDKSFDDNQRSYSNRERDSTKDFRSGGGSSDNGNGGSYSSSSNYKSSRSYNNSYDRDAEPPHSHNNDHDVGESDMARLNLRGSSLQSGSNNNTRFDSTTYNNNSYSSSTHYSGFGSKNRFSDRDRDRDNRDNRDWGRDRDRDWDRDKDRDRDRDWDRGDRDRPSSNGNFGYNPPVSSTRFNFMDRRTAGMTEEEMERELFDTENEMTQGINFDVYDKIPVELSGTDPPEGLANFQDSKLHDQLLYNVLRCKYTKPTPVQKYAVPCIMTGKDLMACAQTGSGKTAAFLLPIIHRMLETPPLNKSHERYSYRSKAYPRAVILSPTRELAIQIEEQARKFLWKTRMKSVVIYGGANASNQLRELSRGCEIIVATPGRLLDFIESGKVGVEYVQFCVLDEGDRMLDMGFMPQIQDIIREMPRKGIRQTLMFSATFPPEIQKLAQEFLSDYLFLAVGRVGSTNTFIRQKMMYVEDREKLKQLMDLLPSCEGLTLIFVETRRDANDVENQLNRHGFEAISIHGDRSQKEREHALAMFRNGKCPVLVATDVAARGLDIPNVLWVINYDLPNNVEAYVHRIGRTGRCGHDGNAVAFVNDKNKPVLQDLLHLLRETKQDVPQWFSEMVYKNRRDALDKRAARNHHRSDYNTRDYRRSQANRDSNFTSRRYNEGRYYGKDKERERDDNWTDTRERNWNSYDRGDGENKMRSFNNGSDLKSRPIGDTAGESMNDSYSKWNFDGKNDSW